MFRRRRPLARAAVVGGAAYAVGRRGRQSGGEDPQPDADAPAAAAPVAAPAPPGAMSDAAVDELKKLAALKEQGVLTASEFDDQKAKLLQGG